MFNGRLVKRKWGWYLVLLNRKHFKVKLLRFWKGKSCSMQYHNYRNELWLFLSGKGLMSYWENPNSNKKRAFVWDFNMTNGAFHHVPIAQIHQYEADMLTYVLEIQYGKKCLEEDIVRV